jgi:hypothetical protein
VAELFEHACLHQGCDAIVQLDNQPFCDEHKIKSVTDYVGYSARKEFNEKLLKEGKTTEGERKNIFDKENNA